MRDKRTALAGGAFLFVVAVTVLAYSPILRNGFVDWEDPAIYLNEGFRGFDNAHLAWIFTTTDPDKYQPFFWLLLAGINRFWGMAPAAYHAASLLLHAAGTGLLFLISARFLGSSGGAVFSSAAAALLFGLHPMQAESMACAAYLGNMLPWILTLGAVFAHIQEAPKISWALALGAGLSGWEAVSLPLILLALDAYPLERLEGRWRQACLEKVPFVLISAGVLLADAFAKSTRAGYHSIGARPVPACFAILHYLEKILAPFGLIPAYDVSGPLGPSGWSAAAAVAAVAAITGGLLLARKRWPAPACAWACFLAGLSPTLAFSRAGPVYAHDRYAYLPAMGFYLLAGAGIFAAIRAWTRARRAWALAVLAAAALALPGLAFLTLRQLGVWRDSVSLWRHVVTVDPGSDYANSRLADALAAAGRDEESIFYFRRLLAAAPGRAKTGLSHAFNNLGVALSEQGNAGEALARFEEALRWEDDPVIHVNAGLALIKAGKPREAAGHFKRALALRPDNAQARAALKTLGM